MELNGVNSNVYTAVTYSQGTAKDSVNETDSSSAKAFDQAAVYEKSNSQSKTTYSNSKVDGATIEKLKADAEERFSSLASLVEKLLTKQGETSRYASLGDLMKGVANGKVEVDPEIVAQAKKDVADDGYWGVEQTAERIVSFAKALTGGDETQVEKMRAAIEKGYKSATKTWGSELPEISKKTINRVNELLDDWSGKTQKQ